jgi:proteasome lid subunit RPN8/RPN11
MNPETIIRSPANVAGRGNIPAAEDWIREGAEAALPLILPESERYRMAALASDLYPSEACGLLMGRESRWGTEIVRAVQARNLAIVRARDRFQIDPREFMAIDREARSEGLEIVGVWHSHPDHPARPSLTDLASAWEGYAYVILESTAQGPGRMCCWRLEGGRFIEQRIEEVRP